MLETPKRVQMHFTDVSAEASLPERVSNSILKVHKVLVVDSQQISTVEIQISFHKHITKSLLLGLLLVPSVSDKRGVFRDLPDQKAHLIYETFNINNCRVIDATYRLNINFL